MKKKTRQIKSIIDEVIKNDKDLELYFSNKVSLIVSLKFNFNTFYKVNNSVSHFFKKLVNNKNSLGNGLNNRQWWYSLSEGQKNSGFYKYDITEDEVSIILFLNSQRMVNELELKSRIKKITPYEMITIELINSNQFKQYFKYLNHLESGFSVFGF